MTSKKRKLREIRLSNGLLYGKKFVYQNIKISNEYIKQKESDENGDIDFIKECIGIKNIKFPFRRLNRIFKYELISYKLAQESDDFLKNLQTLQVKFKVHKA